uniref:Uncharacterized protein n=1 Tax=Anopheles atroparvus TaxID=41427 RepID=A0A182JDZ6_ANOAO
MAAPESSSWACFSSSSRCWCGIQRFWPAPAAADEGKPTWFGSPTAPYPVTVEDESDRTLALSKLLLLTEYCGSRPAVGPVNGRVLLITFVHEVGGWVLRLQLLVDLVVMRLQR